MDKEWTTCGLLDEMYRDLAVIAIRPGRAYDASIRAKRHAIPVRAVPLGTVEKQA